MAVQIGEHALAVGSTCKSSSRIVEDLQAAPGTFAFVQAVDIALRYLREQGLPADKHSFLFTVNPSLAFPPADIDSLSFNIPEDGSCRVNMTLNLLGLHGADSPLPAYFTEHVAQNRDDPDALRDYFNIFNHRIISILLTIWEKYRYYAQYKPAASDILSQRFFGFIGAEAPEVRMAKVIQWPRLMAYMGLIALNGEATSSLENILRHYFRHNEIFIIPCMRRWIRIPDDQQTMLGVQNCELGLDFILGDEIPDQTGKFRIRIENLKWNDFFSFLPCSDKFSELKDVVNFVLKSRFSFDIELRLKPGEIRPWILGDEDNDFLLGWSAWCGTDGDGIAVLETDYGEL